VGSKYLRLWIPYPVSDAYQTIENVSVHGNFDQQGVYRDPQDGNTMLFVRWLQFQGTAEAVLEFEVKRRAFRAPEFGPVRDVVPVEVQRYLEVDAADAAGVAPVATAIRAQHLTIRARARAIYDYVVDHFERDPNVVGCGTGDVPAFLEARKGKCADFSSLYVSMARAAGVPCREVYGIRIGDADQGDITEGYHCWAEFYEPSVGWVPADPSDVRKYALKRGLALDHPDVVGKREYYFGNLEPSRVALGGGKHLALAPRQQLGALPYFMCPYLEVGYENNCKGGDVRRMGIRGLEFGVEYSTLVERTSLIGVGEPLPVFVGRTWDGREYRHSAPAGAAGATVINFFATWCGRCNWESKGMNAIAADYGDRGVRVVRISINEKPEKVAAFARAHGISFPVLVDPDLTLAQLFGVRYVPTTVIADASGKVRYAAGLLPEADLRAQIDAVLRGGR
jgi:peroxiredoxin